MDAFTHNVEAYISKGYHPICDAIALSGARMVWENLPRVMADPRDLEARTQMMMASMMGAIAFQKGLGATHSLAHPLSSDCGMHHGTANAVMLPFVLEFNRPAVAQRLADLAAQFGGGDIAEQVRDSEPARRHRAPPARLRRDRSRAAGPGRQGDSGRLPSAQSPSHAPAKICWRSTAPRCSEPAPDCETR